MTSGAFPTNQQRIYRVALLLNKTRFTSCNKNETFNVVAGSQQNVVYDFMVSETLLKSKYLQYGLELMKDGRNPVYCSWSTNTPPPYF